MAKRVTYLAQLKRGQLPDWNEAGGNVIAGVELLTPGRYNGHEFSKDTVKRIAATTKQLEKEAGYEPPWVYGHEADEPVGTRMTMGYWKNWRMGAQGVEADLEVLDQWRWDDIKRGGMRYLSVEVPWNTPHPKTGVDVGPAVCAVAAVDVPAVRSAALFAEGAAPINLGDFPELANLASNQTMAQLGQKEGRGSMLDWLKGLLGLAQGATDDEVAKAAEQRLKGSAPEHDRDGHATEAAALQERAEAAEAEATRLKEEQAARLRTAHRERVTSELAALVEGGQLPPVIRDRLLPALSLLEPSLTVELGEGAEAKDVSPATEVLEALKALPKIVLREGQAQTTPPGEEQQRKAAAEGIAKER